MKPLLSCFLGILGAALLAQTAQADKVDGYLKAEMAKHQIPGIALEVLRQDKPIKRATYGWANLEHKVPVKPTTAFEIGSITKQFTAAGILLLAQEGKLSVNDPIARYLPGVPAAWCNITVRHLLTHTSGLKTYTGLDGFELRRHLTQEQFIRQISAQPVDFPPGEAFKYCNTGFNLLGYIIENVSGQTYWDFMSQRIFAPLGMRATTNRLPALILSNRAAGYEQANGQIINREYDLTDVFSAGALVSTVEDLARWNAALDGEQLLSASTKAQMWTAQPLNSGKLTKYGFGWYIDLLEGHPNIGHGGATSGFSASIQRFPADHLAVILLSNTDEQIATTLAKHIASLYLQK